jgi:hypothetical protein
MNKAQKRTAIEKMLLAEGRDQDSAREVARDAIKNREPLLEEMCFVTHAEQLLAPIHSSSWIRNRAKNPSWDEEGLIKRLLDSGASPKDLAIFARMMQREYLSNLGCLLDGTLYGAPQLPCNDFRIFAVDDSEKPLTMLQTLHETSGWAGLKAEMKLSRKVAEQAN